MQFYLINYFKQFKYFLYRTVFCDLAGYESLQDDNEETIRESKDINNKLLKLRLELINFKKT